MASSDKTSTVVGFRFTIVALYIYNIDYKTANTNGSERQPDLAGQQAMQVGSSLISLDHVRLLQAVVCALSSTHACQS
jgi:hypothetical protein